MPPTPSRPLMHHHSRPVQLELPHSWSAWRPPKTELPLTPPLSVHPPRRVAEPHAPQQTTLPPISQLDSRLSRISPITPPQLEDAAQWYSHASSSVKLPPLRTATRPPSPMEPDSEAYEEEQRPQVFSPPPEPVDWLTRSTHRSSHFLAEKMCEMVCYLWFSMLSRDASPSTSRQPSIPKPSSATATLQLAVSPDFVRFMQKVLETTQVSQSVIVLALHYIYRLKIRNRFTSGQSGSEYRVAIAALMMANKFLDDNTYTNKTWSEVSGIELEEINRMEREFLLGIDFGLYVDKTTYISWLNLLQGLVMAKERDSRQWRRTPRIRVHAHSRPHRPAVHPSHAAPTQRARSSSPSRPAYALSAHENHYLTPAPVEYHTPPRSGAKRSANDAFSPPLTHPHPAKAPRRPTNLSLDIPQERHHGHRSANSISPSEPLQHFSKLSIGASPSGVKPGSANPSPAWSASVRQPVAPQTLASAYHVDGQRAYAAPQNLYFYSLACSPTEDESRPRKARLRYHQPPVISADYGYAAQPSVPMVVQSASTSPQEVHGHLRENVPTLPHFSELAWNRPRAPAPAPAPAHVPVAQHYDPHAHQHYHQQTPHAVPYHAPIQSGVAPAPFANAGPPGVHFYVNDPQQRPSPLYNRPQNRRL
ncbi:cyclin-domain-containing protein [Phanerochaete sordida]|uniref:Cyclin-domain-containing protein n=1 Tax=Phanerochaete sordida TaxID=48140 RepID=A0A9P3LK50_9APHY|nr:cyclin-domain-containing protein [Phanerochaete sordida]